MSSFEYFILRAVPDRVRGECLNVGLVVFYGEIAKVSVGIENWRLRALNPNLSGVDLHVWGCELESELAKLPSKEARVFFLSAITGPITAEGGSGQIHAESPEDCHAKVARLLHRLVETPERVLRTTASGSQKPSSKLHTQLRSWFRAAKIYSPRVSDLSKGKIVSGYPVLPSQDLFADFALRNGAVHIIETMDLRGVERLTRSVRGEAGWKSILFDQARRVLSEETRRIAIIAADDYAVVRPVIGMVEKYADDLYSMESPPDRQRFADYLSKALHLQELLDPSMPAGG